MFKPKIFVSYTIRDGNLNKNELQKIAKVLNTFTHPFIDLLHNDSINKQDRVLNELKNSDYLVLLKTRDTFKSNWVMKEIKIAKNSNIPILEFDFNLLLLNNYADFFNMFEHSLHNDMLLTTQEKPHRYRLLTSHNHSVGVTA